MKSRIGHLGLCLLLTLSGTVSAQVMPLGKVRTASHVQPASCSSCSGGSHHMGGGFYDGTVWGTSCDECSVTPGLFPPCPNPCHTTLLGEMLYDVKSAVDHGLSHLFGCVLGPCCLPCGCQDVCSCVSDCGCGSGCDGGCDGGCDAGCDAGCDGGYVEGGYLEHSAPQVSSPQPTPAVATPQANPFGDDPAPSSRLQPVPNRSASRMVRPTNRVTPVRRQAVRSGVRRVSFEQGVAEETQPTPATFAVPTEAVQPIRAAVAGHYEPRRDTSLRQAGGAELKRAPLRQDGTAPSLRFRESQ